MAQFVVGDQLEAIADLYSEAGPILGATWTVNTYIGPSGSMATALVSVTEVAGGKYRIRTEPVSAPGTYSVSATPNLADPNDVPFSATWDVDEVWSVQLPVSVSSGMTRKQIRRDVLRVFGDLLIATADSPGTTTTFIDHTTFVKEPGVYASRYALFTGGTAANLGKIRYINRSSRDDASVTFSLALPAATGAGDEIEVINSFGQGVDFASVHDAINRAIRISREDCLIQIKATAVDPFDQETRLIAVPETFTIVTNVQFQDPNTSQWREIDRANAFGQWGWSLDSTEHAIYVAGNDGIWLDGRTVRVYGYGEPPILELDTDVSQVNPQWVVAQVLSDLTGNLMTRGGRTDKWYAAHMEYKAEADRLRPELTPNIGPSAQRFR